MKPIITLSAILGIAFSGMAHAQEPILIKFSHVAAIDTPKGQAAEHFKQQLEKRTKGRVKVEVFANSTLYKDKEELEALQMGSVHMLAPVAGKFGPAGVKEFEVFDLPYIFPPKEARGQKIRINSSKVNQAIIKAIGGLPQTMAFSEVYQALQTGVVDGADGNLSNLYTQKQYEVQKNITLTRHTYSGYVVVMNKAFWEKLPADVKTDVTAAMKDASDFNDKVAEEDENKSLSAIKASGKSTIHTLTADEKARWVKALMPVQDELAPRIGKELISAIRKETGQAK